MDKNEGYPGLAMSRSIGDFVATSVGVISEPEIMEYTITNNTKCIVIASDGVWEFLSNEDVMNIIVPYYNTKDSISAASKLVDEALKTWNRE